VLVERAEGGQRRVVRDRFPHQAQPACREIDAGPQWSLPANRLRVVGDDGIPLQLAAGCQHLLGNQFSGQQAADLPAEPYLLTAAEPSLRRSLADL